MFQTAVAFAIVYVVWGSTYLAIRMAVQTIPPLLAAGVRFFVAGLLLYAYSQLRGLPRPSSREWRSMALVSLCLFVLTYGPLFWAEKSVPSGTASVLAATVPISTMLLETGVFRQVRFSWQMFIAAMVGFAGVVVLMWSNAQDKSSILPALAILTGATAWSLGSVLSRAVKLPSSKVVTSGGEMMLGGLGLLLWSAVAGEWSRVSHISTPSALALAYLVVFGSLIGFTAFVWLLAHLPASRVSSYAYVNPVVAVLLGYFMGGEAISKRTVAGSALIVGSVVLALQRSSPSPAPEPEAKTSAAASD